MWSSATSHSAHSSKSSSTQSIRKALNDSTDNSVKELSSDEEEEHTPTPTPVNELYDEKGWNDATEPLDFTTNKQSIQKTDNRENHQNSQRLIRPQLISTQSPSHSCCHCVSNPYEDCLSTSRVVHMTETSNHLPAIVTKRDYRVCNHCGLTCAHMFFEPMASSYWDHVVPHHHSLHQNFHYRKVFNI